MEQDTIAAIATPLGSSGIGIIRISGPDSNTIAQKLFRPKKTEPVGDLNDINYSIEPYRLIYGHIYDYATRDLVDEVLLAYMQAPKSYTREDVVEIHSHGGSIVVRKLLELVIRCGARLAEPGEFTKRAFLNGRIDLSQAEAVADVISAKSEAALHIAVDQLAGRMKTTITALVVKIIDIQAEIEARIEFCEDIEGEGEIESLRAIIDCELIAPIERLLEDHARGHFVRDGLRLDIVGRPNVGKSSLLNQLIKKDKAIVTAIPGTTRDLVEDYFCIGGIPILITDTAGLHSTDDPVEMIGIQKTKENLSRSDLVLFVVDGSTPFLSDDADIFEHINAKNVILVINKCDLMPARKEYDLNTKYRQLPRVNISALHGQGILELEHAIQELCLGGILLDPGKHLVPTLYQKQSLEQAINPLKRAHERLICFGGDELVAEDLERAKVALNRILGNAMELDVLEEVFSRFCIGK